MKTKRILAVLLAFGMALSFMAGCNASQETTASSTSDTTAAASETDTSTISIDASTEPSASETEIDLSKLTFDEVYGSQLKNYLNHQYKFNGKDIPLPESNFYIINAYVELTQYYGGYYSTPEGFLDLSAEYVDTSRFATFGDFLISYAEKTIQSSCIICDKAAAEGVVLSDDTKKQIDEMVANIKKAADEAKVTLDQYLNLYYGKDCDEAAFRAVLQNYYLSDLYSMKYCETHVTDEMKKVPSIRYALFEAPEATADEQAKSTSEGLAQDLLKAADGSLDKLKTEAEKSYGEGVCKETNDINVKKGTTVQAFENWAYDASRKEGDIGVIYVPEFGYFVVGYLGTVELELKDLESELIEMLSKEINSEIESGKYKFGTDMPYEPAKPISPTPTPEGYVDPVTPTVTVAPDNPVVTPAPGEAGSSDGVRSVAIIIAMVVGGVALIAAIIIITASILKKMRGGTEKTYKASDDNEDDDPLASYGTPEDGSEEEE